VHIVNNAYKFTNLLSQDSTFKNNYIHKYTSRNFGTTVIYDRIKE